ncbi:MAG: hypothetical protein ACPGJV_05235 [Bacteriovoracaceae bacterium]
MKLSLVATGVALLLSVQAFAGNHRGGYRPDPRDKSKFYGKNLEKNFSDLYSKDENCHISNIWSMNWIALSTMFTKDQIKAHDKAHPNAKILTPKRMKDFANDVADDLSSLPKRFSMDYEVDESLSATCSTKKEEGKSQLTEDNFKYSYAVLKIQRDLIDAYKKLKKEKKRPYAKGVIFRHLSATGSSIGNYNNSCLYSDQKLIIELDLGNYDNNFDYQNAYECLQGL